MCVAGRGFRSEKIRGTLEAARSLPAFDLEQEKRPVGSSSPSFVKGSIMEQFRGTSQVLGRGIWSPYPPASRH